VHYWCQPLTAIISAGSAVSCQTLGIASEPEKHPAFSVGAVFRSECGVRRRRFLFGSLPALRGSKHVHTSAVSYGVAKPRNLTLAEPAPLHKVAKRVVVEHLGAPRHLTSIQRPFREQSCGKFC
jgi:hypothetical protein